MYIVRNLREALVILRDCWVLADDNIDTEIAVLSGDAVDWSTLTSEVEKLLVHAALDLEDPSVDVVTFVHIVRNVDDWAIFGERIKTPVENIIKGVHIDGNMEILTIDKLDGLAMLGSMLMEIDLHGFPGRGVVVRANCRLSSTRRQGSIETLGDVVADLIVGIGSVVRSPSARITANSAVFTLDVDWSLRLGVTAEDLLLLGGSSAGGSLGDVLLNGFKAPSGGTGDSESSDSEVVHHF